MWVESVEPLKLDGVDRGASLDGAIGNASLDGVAMLNEGERLVCLIDNFGSPPTFAGDSGLLVKIST